MHIAVGFWIGYTNCLVELNRCIYSDCHVPLSVLYISTSQDQFLFATNIISIILNLLKCKHD